MVWVVDFSYVLFGGASFCDIEYHFTQHEYVRNVVTVGGETVCLRWNSISRLWKVSDGNHNDNKKTSRSKRRRETKPTKSQTKNGFPSFLVRLKRRNQLHSVTPVRGVHFFIAFEPLAPLAQTRCRGLVDSTRKKVLPAMGSVNSCESPVLSEAPVSKDPATRKLQKRQRRANRLSLWP